MTIHKRFDALLSTQYADSEKFHKSCKVLIRGLINLDFFEWPETLLLEKGFIRFLQIVSSVSLTWKGVKIF